VPDYETMSAQEALALAKEASGLTAEEIAARTGISVHVLRRYFKATEESYLPSLERIPPLSRALGNTILLRWMQAKAEPEPCVVQPAASMSQVLAALARVAASVGDVQRRLADSEECGIDPACARDVRGLLGDVVIEAQRAQGMLYQQALARDITEATPLCCLVKKRPWWRRIFGV
jgi:transcriptional regulator with XRE-family HTH domain